MPSYHAWQSCLNLAVLSEQERTQTAEALNWLESNSHEFNDMIYRLRQRQKAYSLEKVTGKPITDSEAIINWLAESFHESSGH